jgi:hypothetical protein
MSLGDAASTDHVGTGTLGTLGTRGLCGRGLFGRGRKIQNLSPKTELDRTI